MTTAPKTPRTELAETDAIPCMGTTDADDDAVDWSMNKRLMQLPSMDLAELIWRMQNASWHMSSQTSIRACKKFTRGGMDGRVVLTETDGTHGNRVRHFSGLRLCGSRQCPRCAQIIAMERARQLEAGLRYWFTSTNEGGQNRSVIFLTLTMKHDRDDQLDLLLTALRDAKDQVFGGYAYSSERGIRQRFRIAGTASALEVTWGHRSGWHPHLHMLLMLDRPNTAEDIARIGLALHERWAQALARHGIAAELSHSDIRPVQGLDNGSQYIAAYLNKNAPYRIAQEMTNQNKSARAAGGWTFYELLAMLCLDRHTMTWFPLQSGQQVRWEKEDNDTDAMTIIDPATGEIIRTYHIHGPSRMWRIIHELEANLKGIQTFRFSNRPKHADTSLDRAWNSFLDHTGDTADGDRNLVDNRHQVGEIIKVIHPDQWLSNYVPHVDRIIDELKPTQDIQDIKAIKEKF